MMAQVSVPLQCKWRWMMVYCRSRRLPPAQGWAWSRAQAAYEQACSSGGT